jgi:hypothetical protein
MGPPSGEPASEAIEGGGPGGIFEKRSVRTFKKEWVPFLERAYFGEASVNY